MLARDRVLAVPDESPDMLLADLVADLEVAVEAGDPGTEPVAGRGALLSVVARQRVAQGPVPITHRDRAQQVVDPLAGVHRLDRDGHLDHLLVGGRCPVSAACPGAQPSVARSVGGNQRQGQAGRAEGPRNREEDHEYEVDSQDQDEHLAAGARREGGRRQWFP